MSGKIRREALAWNDAAGGGARCHREGGRIVERAVRRIIGNVGRRVIDRPGYPDTLRRGGWKYGNVRVSNSLDFELYSVEYAHRRRNHASQQDGGNSSITRGIVDVGS